MLQKPASFFNNASRGQTGHNPGHNQAQNGAPAHNATIHGGSHSTAVNRHSPSGRTLVVGSGISVQGKILDAECLIVEGKVEAEHLEAKEVIIAPGGFFHGTIDVENADISGTIDGTLTVRKNLTVQTTGRLLGNAECRSLQVENGGQITGKLNVITDGGETAKTSSSSTTRTQKSAAAE